MTRPMRLEGRRTLITGAASGIGRALAVALASRGARLALVDLDGAGLAETAGRIGSASGATLHRLDVADREAVAAMPEQIQAALGGLDILVNNAGVALGGGFEQIDAADFDWLFAINFHGLVQMTRTFLPMLHRSDDARIVNISSVFGLIAPPGQTAYVASKFAVRGFSESLRHELAASRIGVTTVHPGGITTAIATNARAPRGAPRDEVERQKRAFQAKLTLAPERAAEAIVDAIVRRRARAVIGTDAKIAAAIERLLPVTYWNVLKRLTRQRKGAGD